MTEMQKTGYPSVDQDIPEDSGWVGWIFFAGVMLVLLGTFQVIAGLVALFKDDFYAVTSNKLVLEMSYTAWGWTHLILGVVALFAGYGVMRGQTWARIFAIVLAGISAIANLAFLSAYPVWGVVMITVDILVIYALAVYGRELKST